MYLAIAPVNDHELAILSGNKSATIIDGIHQKIRFESIRKNTAKSFGCFGSSAYDKSSRRMISLVVIENN